MIVGPQLLENFDNNHCLQASILMILSVFGQDLSFKEVDGLTAYDPLLYTWTIVGVSLLQQKLTGVIFYSSLDYSEFAKQGENYLKNFWSASHYQLQKSKSSQHFQKEQQATKDFLNQGGMFIMMSNKFTEQDFSYLLKNNILICFTNLDRLYSGFSGNHYVVLYAETADRYIFNDSGLGSFKRGKAGRKMDKSAFLAAVGEVIVIPKNGSKVGAIIGKKETCYCRSKKWFKKCHKQRLEKEGLLVLE